KGTPVKVVTPNKTILYRHNSGQREENIVVFTNDKSKQGKTSDDMPVVKKDGQLANEFYQSNVYKAIKVVKEKTKTIFATANEKLLKETNKENHEHHGKRKYSQNEVMAKDKSLTRQASASKLIEATKLFSGPVKGEWLHLIAHFILGEK